jgi:hypothetical protein
MLEDKAMIIIAVSKYAGAYASLPGAITSARRLREWAGSSRLCVIIFAYGIVKCLSGNTFRTILSKKLSV